MSNETFCSVCCSFPAPDKLEDKAICYCGRKLVDPETMTIAHLMAAMKDNTNEIIHYMGVQAGYQ